MQASNAELLPLQLKRYKLEKWVREPFFDKTVIGCLVKVAYNGKYHVAEVVDVQEREPGRTRYAVHHSTTPCQRCHNLVAVPIQRLQCIKKICRTAALGSGLIEHLTCKRQ